MIAYNLPGSAIPFIGREDELRQIAALLHDPTCHLLTLTGPGGIGKTRLAIEVARLMVDDNETGRLTTFPDGCCFVPLQPLTSPDFIVPAIANALHIIFRGELDPKQQLFHYLRRKHLLLVLDNFEHLAEGVDLLPEMLEAAPNLKLLVTSRERLHLREEWLFDVVGLTFPEDALHPAWQDFTAVQLFLQSARRGGYAPVDADTTSIVDICQLVEGIPLALDLAAAWVRVMPCADIAHEITRSLDILTTTTRNVPARHRSIYAAFELSWEMLTGEEQAAFSKLAVFRGGFTREGAEQVAGATLATLVSLVDKSLVQVDATGRYDLHELLRQFAAEKLLDAGETDTAVQRHIDYFLWLAERAEAHAFGRGQIAWFDRMEIEFDNLRAAFTRSFEIETGLRLAGALGWFFSERGHWREGLEWLEQTVVANPGASVSLRAKALHSAGALAGFFGEYQRAIALCEKALALAQAANDRWNVAWSLSHLTVWMDWTDQSAAMLDESLALFRELDDAMGIAHTLVRRSGIARIQGDYADMRSLLEEAQIYIAEAGDRITMGWVNYELGRVSRSQERDLGSARIHFQTGLSLFREARFQVGIHNILLSLAGIEVMLGNLDQAGQYNEEALSMLWEKEPGSSFLGGDLKVLASITKARGQFERAAILLGAADSGQWGDTAEVMDSDCVPFESDEEAIRDQLGEAAFNEAWAVGTAMTAEQAITYALEDRIVPIEIGQTATSETASSANQAQAGLLNAREIEVLSLAADGLSNHQIAGQLFLSVNTVKWYLKGIYGKLQAANRAQAVARAQALGLLFQEYRKD